MANDGTASDGLAHNNIPTLKALTRANLKAHQQALTSAGSGATPVQIWLAESCDRPLGGHTTEAWKRLVAEDKLATDIEAALQPETQK